MNTQESRIQTHRLLPLVLAMFCGQTSSSYSQSPYVYRPPQQYTVVAQQGAFGMTSVLPEHSVNNMGRIAFLGTFPESGSGTIIPGVFHADLTSNQIFQITGFSQAFASQLGPSVLINDSNRILTRRVNSVGSPLGPITYSYLTVWDLNSGFQSDLQTAYPNIPGLPFPEFNGIYGTLAYNNSGGYAFTGFAGDTNYLAAHQGFGARAPFGTGTPLPDSLMAADEGRMVLRVGNLVGGSIRLASMPGIFPLESLADSSGYSQVGARPGISDNGRFVVFYGNAIAGNSHSVDPGPGIFAYFRPLGLVRRVAGLHGDGYLAPGEFWDDNADGTRDWRFNAGGDQDIGLFTGFVPDAQLAVNNNGEVVFLAKDGNGATGVFYAKLNVNTFRIGQETFTTFGSPSDPYCLAATGDQINGLPGTVTELALSDSAGSRSSNGDFAFWARTTASDGAIVALTPKHRPVIFLPGIGASELAIPDKDDLWLPTDFLNPLSKDDILQLSLAPGREDPRVVPTDVLRKAFGIRSEKTNVYNIFLEQMAELSAFREYLPGIVSSGNTVTYSFPASVKDTHPDLFLFPYDWRQDNEINARRLRQYINKVRLLYPDTEVDLICHSMGGLVARRYLMLHPGDHHINRCVTIGSPLLGTPVAYERLLAGRFFQVAPLDWGANESVLQVLPTFPAFHQLMPSREFLNLRDGPVFEERGWDFNNNGIRHEVYAGPAYLNEFDGIRQAFDSRFPQYTPVASNDSFHTSLQDNWKTSGYGVEYMHVVGVQSGLATPIRTVARGWAELYYTPLFGLRIRFETDATTINGRGDRTVAYESAYRSPAHWAPGTKMVVVQADPNPAHDAYKDGLSEHSALTQNPRVLRAMLYFLRSGNRLWSDPELSTPLSAPPVPGPLDETPHSRELLSLGLGNVIVTSPAGVSTVEQVNFEPVHPSDVAVSSGLRSSEVSYAPYGDHTFRFEPDTRDRFLGLLELRTLRIDGSPLQTVRFLDVAVPAGAALWIADSGSAPYILNIDTDNDGSPDSAVTPNYVSSGSVAADVEPPVLTPSLTKSGNDFVFSLTSEDTDSGLHNIYFQLGDGNAQVYTGPVTLAGLSGNSIRAFATDLAGNRSAPFEIPVLPQPRLRNLLNGSFELYWTHVPWDLILEDSTDMVQWSSSILEIRQEGAEDRVTITPDGRRFYRLRLRD